MFEVSYALTGKVELDTVEDKVPYVPLSDIEPEPETYSEAIESRYRNIWVQAMNAELAGLRNTNTFYPAEKPDDRKAIGAKWLFRWKTDQAGCVVKAKARVVAKGFSQVEGVDYLDTFAPTPATSSIRLLAAFACEKDLDMYHFDAEQAFLQSKLDEEIYLRLPPGCENDSGSTVRLNKSIYGLKQAGRAWNSLLTSTLKEQGFSQNLADPCTVRLMDGPQVEMILAVHVDDMIVVGTKADCDHLRESLAKTFPTKNLGELTWYMGCLFERDRANGTLKISQPAFVDVLTERFNVESASPLPAYPTVELAPRSNNEPVTDEPYREAVGCLLWLSNMTRLDIADSVRTVARFCDDPGSKHWKAVRKILSYVAGTRDFGLNFKRGVGAHLSAYADASYAPSEIDRKSVSGGAVMYAGGTVKWLSRTQKVVALSSTESEYLAIGDIVKEALFIRNVLEFFDPGQSMVSIPVHEDNAGAIKLVENPLSSARSRHIDIRHHFVRGLCESGIIRMVYVPTDQQHADTLTKSLGIDAFTRHRNALMNIEDRAA